MAGDDGKLEHAYLDIEGGTQLHCWFNPKEYSISKSSTFNPKAAPGKDFPTMQYGGGQPASLTVDLLFDAFKPEVPEGHVMGIAAELWKLLQVKPGGGKRGRPPQVEFKWGKAWTFKSFVESLTIQYLRFAPSGAPTRMLAKLKLKQAEREMLPASSAGGTNPRGQNPTTVGLAGLATHVVRDGDTLQSIAFAHYEDPTRWRQIAEANGIDDPMRLRRGTNLTIPRDE
jgi:hypothetical protein